ncbi:MAG: CHAT domain-containing protein [Oscillochloris sp.]|nr:CHAT domain-containing protein [Oscillochloris sp.]
MHTIASATLEISIHPDGSGGSDSYVASPRFWLPGSAVEVELIENHPPKVSFDLDALRALSGDMEDYGRRLSADLFDDSRMREAFVRARTQAESSDLPLRVAIRLEAGVATLHRIAWETLRDPERDVALASDERVLITRYLDSGDMTPLIRRPRAKISALIVVASPHDLPHYNVQPVNVTDTIARAEAGLGNIPAKVLATECGSRPTMTAILAALRDEPTVLYLICHGVMRQKQFCICLEQEDGSIDFVDGMVFANAIAGLSHRPSLVMLIACDSAGRAHSTDRLLALGPRLARAGVPAVLAMQGLISIETAAKLMPVFFRELTRDGQIDRALAVARFAVRKRFDWWVPVLFLRVRDGMLWANPRDRWHALAMRLVPAAIAFTVLGSLLALLYWLLCDRYLLSSVVLIELLTTLAAACLGWSELVRSRRRPPAATALALLGTVALLVVIGWQSWNILHPPQIPIERFGIAVARFGEVETFQGTELARKVTNQIKSSIELSIREQGLSDKVTVISTGLVKTAAEARQRGLDVQADLVIWGQLVTYGEGMASINFEVLDVADRSTNPQFPQVLPAVSNLPFAYLKTELQPEQISQLVPQQIDVITSFSLGLAASLARDGVTAQQQLQIAADKVSTLPHDDANAAQRAGIVYFYLGRALLQTGRLEEGDAEFVQAGKLLPEDPAVPLSRAYIANSLGHEADKETLAQQAINLANLWIEQHKENLAVSYNRALAYGLRKQYRDAAENLDVIISHHPEFYVAYLSAAQMRMQLEEFDNAIRLLQTAVEQGRNAGADVSWGTLLLAEAFNRNGNSDEAARLYATAVALAPNVDWMHYQYARFFEKQRHDDEALEEYNKMLEASFDKAWVHSVRAAFCARTGRLEEAINDYREVRQLRPSDTLAQIYLAELYMKTKQKQLGLQTYQEALQQKPDLIYGLNSYGNALFGLGDYTAAMKQYNAALAIKPKESTAYFNLGRVYEAIGNIPEALTIYETIIAAKPPGDYSDDAAERIAAIRSILSQSTTPAATATSGIAPTPTNIPPPIVETPTDTATMGALSPPTPTDTPAPLPTMPTNTTPEVAVPPTPIDTPTPEVVVPPTPIDTPTPIVIPTPTEMAKLDTSPPLMARHHWWLFRNSDTAGELSRAARLMRLGA